MKNGILISHCSSPALIGRENPAPMQLWALMSNRMTDVAFRNVHPPTPSKAPLI
jgi:hypothetical protein